MLEKPFKLHDLTHRCFKLFHVVSSQRLATGEAVDTDLFLRRYILLSFFQTYDNSSQMGQV